MPIPEGDDGTGAVRAAWLTLARVAEATGGRVVGDGASSVRRISTLRDGGPGDLAFLADRRYTGDLDGCRAGALLVSEALSGCQGGPRDRVVVDDARQALVTLLGVFHPLPPQSWTRHPSAVVHPAANLPDRAEIGAGAVVGAGVVIGDRARIGAHCVVGEQSRIGDDTVLHPHVTLYPGVRLGRRVIVHAGSRIGVDGFGYIQEDGSHIKVPQVGGCIVGDDVEIGANCTIDRGSLGNTRIGAGAKLDNLVHLGHNVEIGARAMIVAQVGIAGSTRVGEGAALGGQAGLVGHLTIGAGARIGAQAGVISDIAPGQVVSGYPARDHRRYLRAMARLMRLSRLAARVGSLERRVAATEPHSKEGVQEG